MDDSLLDLQRLLQDSNNKPLPNKEQEKNTRDKIHMQKLNRERKICNNCARKRL